MLAAEPPFRGASARMTIAKQVTENPRPLRSLRPEVSVAIERVIAKALAKNPANRQSTIAEFIGALDQARTVERSRLVQQDQAVLALEGERDAKARRP